MLNIFLAGGLDESDPQRLGDARMFARYLGAEVIAQGHRLINGCRTSFDAAVAEGAWEHLQQSGLTQTDRIVSYVLRDNTPIHDVGRIVRSQLKDWDLGSPKLRIPEPIETADVVILVGGYDGTHRAANWTRISDKPLLPVTRFGGTSEQVYGEELERFDKYYSSRVKKMQFEVLADVASPLPELAKSVISLAEQVRVSKSVFVIMSFADDPLLHDAFESFKETCKTWGYECSRVDGDSKVSRILPEIWDRIRQCAFAIVDLSDERVNVYFELGFAEALGKPLIVTAKEGTPLPFDAKDIPTIFWKGQKGLKEQLLKKIEEIAKNQGR